MANKDKYLRIFYTFVATFLMVGASLGIIYLLNLAKHKYTYDNASYAATILSIAISLVITVVNTSLTMIVRYLSLNEHMETQTEHNVSVSVKLVLVRFVNTAISPIIININPETWFVDGGLVSDIFYIFISTNLLVPLLQLVDVSYIL